MADKPFSRLLNTLQIRRDYKIRPAGLKWRSQTVFIISTVALGLFSDLFLYSLVVPVLPFLLHDRVGIPRDQIQSQVSAQLAVYGGASVIAAPVAGVLADRMSTRQAPFLMSLFALLAGTLLFFLGTTVPVLILARILQGISVAAVWTVGLAICVETVGPQNLGKTIGSMFSFISAGALLSPVIGGGLYEKLGYLSVCILGLSIIAVDLIMRLIVIEKKVAARYEITESTSEAGASNITNGSDQQDDEIQQSNPDVQSREREPLLRDKRDNSTNGEQVASKENDDDDYSLPAEPTGLVKAIPILPCFKNRRLLAATYGAFIQALLIGAFDATMTIVANELFGFKSLKAGILILPLGIADVIMGPIVGRAIDKYGTKRVLVLSYVCFIPVLVLLRLPHAGGLDQVILYGGLLLLCGFCFAGTGAPPIVEAGYIVERYYRANPAYFGDRGPFAQLYGITNMLFSFGLTIGPELAGEMKRVIGYGNMNIILAVLCAFTAALCFICIGPLPEIIRKRQKTAAQD